jgi:threonine synthase
MEKSGYLLDPHSATALAVARQRPRPDVPMVVLATAHPAKFPAAVEAACGVAPGLPARLADLMRREERFTALPSDIKMVEDHILRHSRAAR